MPGLVVPCAAALVAGVAASGPWPKGQGVALLLAAAAGAAALVAHRGGRPVLAATLLPVACLPWGWWLGSHAHERALARPVRVALADALARARGGEVTHVSGRLREDALQYETGVVLIVDLAAVREHGRWRAIRGAVRLSVPGEVDPAIRERWRRGRCVRAPVLLRIPVAFRNPGVPDADVALARRHLDLVGSAKSASLIEACGDGPAWQEAAGRFRDRLRRAIDRHVAGRDRASAAVVTAILVGDRAAIGDEVEERLRRAGTFHVLAISGGNIAILTGVLLSSLILLRVPSRVALSLTIVGLTGYAAIVVRGPSVDRALVVALVYLVTRLADLRPHPLALLASVATVLVIADPLVVFDVGFALTFGATTGILIVTPAVLDALAPAASPMARGEAGVARRVAWFALVLLVATVGAEAAVGPVAAVAFGRVTFAGLLLNFVAIPAMTVIQVAGLLVAASSHVLPLLADAAGLVAHVAVRAMVESARLVDAWPWLERQVPPPSAWLVAIYLGAVVVACHAAAPWRLRLASTGVALAGVAAMTLGWMPAGTAAFHSPLTGRDGRNAWLRVTMLDVGQGDAVVVQFPGDRAMLVDAGGLPGSPAFDIGRRVVTPALHGLGIRRLEWLVLTHGDPDHVGGALRLVEDWQPREVWEGIPVRRHEALQALRRAAARLGVAWRQTWAGDEIVIGGVTLRVWHPAPPEWERQRVRNDDSIVLELVHGRTTIVLPGDIGSVVERQLVPRIRPGEVTILKAAHHGSAGSSDPSFLEALRPAVVIYSAGRHNRFGHPSPEALRRAARVGAVPFRTDEDGAVQVLTDGWQVVVVGMTGRWWGRR